MNILVSKIHSLKFQILPKPPGYLLPGLQADLVLYNLLLGACHGSGWPLTILTFTQLNEPARWVSSLRPDVVTFSAVLEGFSQGEDPWRESLQMASAVMLWCKGDGKGMPFAWSLFILFLFGRLQGLRTKQASICPVKNSVVWVVKVVVCFLALRESFMTRTAMNRPKRHEIQDGGSTGQNIEVVFLALGQF